MAIWTVFEPADTEATTQLWAQEIVFLREGFSWSALFLAPLVLLFHRLWLGFLAYLLIQAALVGTVFALDVDSDALVLLCLTHLAVALMLPDLRRGKLALAGFEEAGVVVARRLEEAEQRYFEARLIGGLVTPRDTGRQPRREAVASSLSLMPARPVEGTVLGLFPEAGR
ncbi:DUF2628 domain-containing protein [Ancylobacter pratisalsi]|uniref:DUF2628 domain-containing protein n=1 Tax=Ancylobacter pratisalsi TaxID=1745854 RepID=A0A6P1YKS8_9HYPH|nr:DUF2628 domain-containing protein [Ancylobacter pratisalsi]QIB34017.1 DUF2628 domain-containing protein [Ancylobacter pratisalsi]